MVKLQGRPIYTCHVSTILQTLVLSWEISQRRGRFLRMHGLKLCHRDQHSQVWQLSRYLPTMSFAELLMALLDCDAYPACWFIEVFYLHTNSISARNPEYCVSFHRFLISNLVQSCIRGSRLHLSCLPRLPVYTWSSGSGRRPDTRSFLPLCAHYMWTQSMTYRAN